MQPTRRQFMKQAGTVTLGAAALSAMPASLRAASPVATAAGRKPTLVAVYLRGGADALSTIIPFSDATYATLRPTLAIAAPDANAEHKALALDNRFAFNPNLKALHTLYDKKLCAPIVAVGSPHPTRSHFDAQDFMERAAPGLRYVTTGWLNRYLSDTATSRDASLRAFSLQPLLPRSLRGEYPVLAVPEQGATEAMDVFEKVYGDEMTKRRPVRDVMGRSAAQTIQRFGTQTIVQLRELQAIIDASKTAVEYPDHSFGRQMRDIAAVIKADKGLEVAALDYRGWDHHYNEGPIDGTLGTMLGNLSAAIGAFTEDLGPRMDQVLVLVMSEFGRTVRENGNQGTDHGHGGFMLAVGGMVEGGKVYGNFTSLADNELYEKRDLPVHTDFRTVFAETLQQVFSYNAIKEGLFPDYTPDSQPLNFLRQA